jgi:hypothetical protein
VNLNPSAYKGESYPPDYLSFIEIGGKKYPIARGMIGDAGNQPHIGECSYAFGRLIQTTGAQLFEAWGGKDQLTAVLALPELKSSGR